VNLPDLIVAIKEMPSAELIEDASALLERLPETHVYELIKCLINTKRPEAYSVVSNWIQEHRNWKHMNTIVLDCLESEPSIFDKSAVLWIESFPWDERSTDILRALSIFTPSEETLRKLWQHFTSGSVCESGEPLAIFLNLYDKSSVLQKLDTLGYAVAWVANHGSDLSKSKIENLIDRYRANGQSL